MKLKLTHRLILYVGALLMILMGIAILLGSLQFNEIPIRTEGQRFLTPTRLALLFGGVAAVMFGLFCLSLPHRMKQGKADFVTQKTPSGEMRISIQAIETIIQKSLSQYEEIKLLQLQVINARNGVEVDLKASLANNINIPQAVNALQKHIRQHLSATIGIDAKEIRIIVDNAEITASESQYQVKTEALDFQKEAGLTDNKLPSEKLKNTAK